MTLLLMVLLLLLLLLVLLLPPQGLTQRLGWQTAAALTIAG
jgi:hypothetical protein